MASDISLPAFLSSSYGSTISSQGLLPEDQRDQPYRMREEAETKWKETVGNNNEDIPLPEDLSTQAEWDTPLVKLKYDQLVEHCGNREDKARLLAVAAEHASDWLNARPDPNLGLKMDNNSVRVACGLRLGTSLCQSHNVVQKWTNLDVTVLAASGLMVGILDTPKQTSSSRKP